MLGLTDIKNRPLPDKGWAEVTESPLTLAGHAYLIAGNLRCCVPLCYERLYAEYFAPGRVRWGHSGSEALQSALRRFFWRARPDRQRLLFRDSKWLPTWPTVSFGLS